MLLYMFFPPIKVSAYRVLVLFLVLVFVNPSAPYSSAVASPVSSVASESKLSSHNNKIKLVVKKKKKKVCENKLAEVLFRVGFEGQAHRHAWAIAMRESRGHKGAISHTNDYGLFQFNKATWGKQDWWKESRLLKRKYNAKIAYKISRGGQTWYPWGLSGKGKVRAKIYRNIGWSKSQIRSHIKKPYRKFYRDYVSLPKACRAR